VITYQVTLADQKKRGDLTDKAFGQSLSSSVQPLRLHHLTSKKFKHSSVYYSYVFPTKNQKEY
jgi:hypothetical protein